MASREICLDDGYLRYIEDYIPEPSSLFSALHASVGWQQPVLTVFGRSLPTRRLVSFVGDAGLQYQYSGHQHIAEPWPRPLADIRRRLREDFGLEFNTALLNYYRDGSEQMGYHSDDEIELGPNPAIASVSLGAPRDLVFRRKGESRQRHAIALDSGSLLLMLPPTQQFWQHALPARKRVREGRINITFRNIDPKK